MGLVFEAGGQQHEVCTGPLGVWHINLTTHARRQLRGAEDVPEGWPQNVKDTLRTASFVRYEQCHVCGMPEAPLCGCTHGLGDNPEWRVPAVLARTHPPPAIDPLHHTVDRAVSILNLLCVLESAEDRARLKHNAVALITKYAARQRLVADEARRHYEEGANTVLRKYARACHETIAGLWRERKDAYRENRRDMLLAITGGKECLSCHARAPLCVSAPCCHASMCSECWEQWGKGDRLTCPECREEVQALHRHE